MTNPIAPPAGLPTMLTHIEGTPALVRKARMHLAKTHTVVDAEVHYQGSGYAAIEVSTEDEAAIEFCRSIDDEAYKAKTGQRLLWGYVGPMTCTVRMEARDVTKFLAAVARTGALVDRVKADGNWTTFRTNCDENMMRKIGVLGDCGMRTCRPVARQTGSMARTSSVPGQRLGEPHIRLLRELPITQNNQREVRITVHELDAMLDEIEESRAKRTPA